MGHSIYRRGRRSQQGMALVVSLVIATMVMGMGAAYLRIHMANMARQNSDVDRWRSFYVAEAGLAEAYLAVAQGRTGNIGSQAQPASFGNGLCWVEVEELGDNRLALHSTGMVGRGRSSLGLVLERAQNPVGELGFFGEESVVIEPGVEVLGTDSDAPLGAEAVPGSAEVGEPGAGGDDLPDNFARVGSNGDIEIQASSAMGSTVEGSVQPGPAGIVILDPGSQVAASTAPRKSKASLPTISVPTIVKEPAKLHSDSGSPLVLSSGDFGYDSMVVARGAVLRLVGPLRLVVDNLSVLTGSTLEIDTSSGPVAVYVANQLDLDAGSQLIDTHGDPSLVLWYVESAEEDPTGGIGDFAASGQLVGQFYAPHAELSVPASLEVIGSISVRSLIMQTGLRATFDLKVTRSSLGVQAMPESLGWRVVEFPEGTVFGDAAMIYRLQGVVPVPMNEAQRERLVRMTYMDDLGVVQTFEGDPRTMDPDRVAATVDVQWIDPDDNSSIDNPGLQGMPNVPTITATGSTAEMREADATVMTAADSAEARDRLLATTPTQDMLLEALRLDPAMQSADLRDVLIDNIPLGLVVGGAVAFSPALTVEHKGEIGEATATFMGF